MDVTSGAAVAAFLFDFYDVVDPAAPDKKYEKKKCVNGEPLRVLDL